MTRAKAKSTTDTAPKKETKKRPKWEEDDNGTCFTHTADNGHLYIAQVLDDGTYAVTVTAGGQVLYSTRASNDDVLDGLVA